MEELVMGAGSEGSNSGGVVGFGRCAGEVVGTGEVLTVLHQRVVAGSRLPLLRLSEAFPLRRGQVSHVHGEALFKIAESCRFLETNVTPGNRHDVTIDA
jgi:hypothetical protein